MHTGTSKGDYTHYPKKVSLAPGYHEHREASISMPSEYDNDEPLTVEHAGPRS